MEISKGSTDEWWSGTIWGKGLRLEAWLRGPVAGLGTMAVPSDLNSEQVRGIACRRPSRFSHHQTTNQHFVKVERKPHEFEDQL